jgi:hypothetical protein
MYLLFSAPAILKLEVKQEPDPLAVPGLDVSPDGLLSDAAAASPVPSVHLPSPPGEIQWCGIPTQDNFLSISQQVQPHLGT